MELICIRECSTRYGRTLKVGERYSMDKSRSIVRYLKGNTYHEYGVNYGGEGSTSFSGYFTMEFIESNFRRVSDYNEIVCIGVCKNLDNELYTVGGIYVYSVDDFINGYDTNYYSIYDGDKLFSLEDMLFIVDNFILKSEFDVEIKYVDNLFEECLNDVK